jgi:hypothetical protein
MSLFAQPSGQPNLIESVLVEPEVMPDLVEDGDAYLLFEIALIRESVFERLLINHDSVRNDEGVSTSAFGLRHAVVYPELIRTAVRRRFLHYDGEVVERLANGGIKLKEDPVYELFESKATGSFER